MKMNITKIHETVIIEPLAREIDASVKREFKEHILQERNSGMRYILDLRNVSFIDSSGCGVIMSLFLTFKGLGLEFCLANVQARVLPIFEILRMHKMMKIYDDLERAVEVNSKEGRDVPASFGA